MIGRPMASISGIRLGQLNVASSTPGSAIYESRSVDAAGQVASHAHHEVNIHPESKMVRIKTTTVRPRQPHFFQAQPSHPPETEISETRFPIAACNHAALQNFQFLEAGVPKASRLPADFSCGEIPAAGRLFHHAKYCVFIDSLDNVSYERRFGDMPREQAKKEFKQPSNRYILSYAGNKVVGAFDFYPDSAQPGAVYVNSVVLPEYQSKGIRDYVGRIRDKLLKEEGFSIVRGSVYETNQGQIDRLEREGWQLDEDQPYDDITFFLRPL